MNEKIMATNEPEKIFNQKKPIFKTPQERFKALGAEHWKVYIDAKHQSMKIIQSRRKTYDKGNHGGMVEQGYHKSMKAANNLVIKTLNKHLDFKLYHEIHKLAMQHRKLKAGKVRSGHVTITLKIKDKDPNLEKYAWELLSFKKINSEIYQVIYKNVNIKETFNSIIKKYYSDISFAKTFGQKLEIIASTHQALERLHVFEDGNARINKLILNKFLGENDMDLCILETPLGVEHTGLKKWIEKIKKGQEFWQFSVGKVSIEQKKIYFQKQEKKELEKERFNTFKMGFDYESSDTSSEGGINVKQEYLETINTLIEDGDIEVAVNLLKEAEMTLEDFFKKAISVATGLSRKRNTKAIIGLVKYFKKIKVSNKEWNKSRSNEGKLQIWLANCYFELYLQNKKQGAFKMFLKHITLVLQNTKNIDEKKQAIELLMLAKQQPSLEKNEEIKKLLIKYKK